MEFSFRKRFQSGAMPELRDRRMWADEAAMERMRRSARRRPGTTVLKLGRGTSYTAYAAFPIVPLAGYVLMDLSFGSKTRISTRI